MRAQKGFTMIEILVAIGILAIIFAIGLLMNMDLYRGYSRRSERDTLVSVLERARSRAMANVNQHAWGACFDRANHNYIIFNGASYSGIPSDTLSGNPSVAITPATTKLECGNGGIVFDQLTGDTSAVAITMTQGAITSNISTNAEGLIIW